MIRKALVLYIRKQLARKPVQTSQELYVQSIEIKRVKSELWMANQASLRRDGMENVRKLRGFLLRSLPTLDQDSKAQLLLGNIIPSVVVQTIIPQKLGWE